MRRGASIAVAVLALAAMSQARGDYLVDVGFARLASEQGANTPRGAGVAVDHTEAWADWSTESYIPDPTNAAFAGKTFSYPYNGPSPHSSVPSPHATIVGQHYYGVGDAAANVPAAMASGVTQITCYDANYWLAEDFLNFGYAAQPLSPGNRRINNHSWIAYDGNPATNDLEIVQRLDWVVSHYDQIQVVGTPNRQATDPSVNTTWSMMVDSFNAIAVGLSSNLHQHDSTSLPGTVYTAGRTRPDVVVPEGATSFATPVVSSAAAILVGLGHSDPTYSGGHSYTSGTLNQIYYAESPQAIRAMLMAGANRRVATPNSDASGSMIADYRADSANCSDNGLDRRFGAGQLNVYNSYKILVGGLHASQEAGGGTSPVPARAWDYAPSFGGLNGSDTTASYAITAGTNGAVFTASLVWNVDIAMGPTGIADPLTAASLAHLEMALYDVTNPGNAQLVASSASLTQNTQNIMAQLKEGTPYVMQLTVPAGMQFDVAYGLAWHTQVAASWLSGSTWSAMGNWADGIVPNGADQIAYLGSSAAPRSITADLAVVLGILQFDSPYSYTLTGSNSLTMAIATGTARIDVLSGSHTIDLPLIAADNTDVSIYSASDSLWVSGSTTVEDGKMLSKYGAGTLTFDGTLDLGSSGQLDIVQGVVNLGAPLPPGFSATVSAAPEPASLSLLVLGAATLLWRRRGT